MWFKLGDELEDLNVIMVTHGLTLRLFLMRYFQYTVEEFEASTNPSNGDIIILEREDGLEDVNSGRYLRFLELGRKICGFGSPQRRVREQLYSPNDPMVPNCDRRMRSVDTCTASSEENDRNHSSPGKLEIQRIIESCNNSFKF